MAGRGRRLDVEATEIMAMAAAESRPPRCSRAAAIISGVRASPRPWAARPASRTPSGSGRTVTALPAATTPSVPSVPTTATTSAISSSALVRARAWPSLGSGSRPVTGRSR